MILNTIGGIAERAHEMTFTVASNSNIVDNEYTISGVNIPTDTIKGFYIRANTEEQISSAEKGAINFLRLDDEYYEYIDFVYIYRYASGGSTYEGYTIDTSDNRNDSYSYQFDRANGTLKFILHKSTFNKSDPDVTYSNMFLKAGSYTLVVWW